MLKTNGFRVGRVAFLASVLTGLMSWQSIDLFAQPKAEEETLDQPLELSAPSVTATTFNRSPF